MSVYNDMNVSESVVCLNVDGSLCLAFTMRNGIVVGFIVICLSLYLVESGLLSNFLPPNGSIDVVLGGKVIIYMIDLRSCHLRRNHESVFVGKYTFRTPPVVEFLRP